MIGRAEVHVFRGDHLESRHQVVGALADPSGALLGSCGREAIDEPVFLRSTAKPFQAAAVVASGAADRFAFADDEIAILAASHSGEPEHVAVVAEILSKLGLDQGSLRCGVHPPFDPTDGAPRSPLHHNCSGKHAGMLALAIHLGQDPKTYLDPDGPVQLRVREAVATATGTEPGGLVVAIDGCGAPTFAVPLRAAARAMALLARGEAAPPSIGAGLARIAAAMARHPHLVGGRGRFDTRLMEAAAGSVIAKAGAEGVQGVADLRAGVGTVIKVWDGASRAVAPAMLELLRLAGSIDETTLAVLDDLRHPPIANHVGRVVGRIEAEVVLERAR